MSKMSSNSRFLIFLFLYIIIQPGSGIVRPVTVPISHPVLLVPLFNVTRVLAGIKDEKVISDSIVEFIV